MSKNQMLLSLMQQYYAEIRELETRFQIYGHEGDYRPRIEYYHDAVRALGGDIDDGLTKDSRLSVERLAYDMEMLRIISARPLQGGRGEQHLSTGDAVTADGFEGSELRPNRKTKQELAELYKNYTVYFAAIMAERADENVNMRTEESDMLISDCHTLEQLLDSLAQGTADLQTVIKAANMIEHDGLRRKILALLNQGMPNKGELNSAKNTVTNARHYFQHEQQAMDAAGMRFSSSQLMVYEESRDIVKKLVGQGVNIAGKHTEQSLQGAKDKGGRGF